MGKMFDEYKYAYYYTLRRQARKRVVDALNRRIKTDAHRQTWRGVTLASIKAVELPPESGPPTGIDYPSNWRISDGWKTREAGRDCIEASAG
jgi:hypothetical protein